MATYPNPVLMETFPFDTQFFDQQHSQTNPSNLSLTCSFCEDVLPTQDALRQHLMLCGNKTDECPKCRQLIRRSHFAYHYENNCASIDDLETPPNQRRIQTTQRLPVNLNRPYSREDVSDKNYPQERIIRNQSPDVNLRRITLTIQCEYCRQQFVQAAFKIHKDNCLRNPANVKNRQQPGKTFQPNHNQNQNQNQGPSNGIVHIPCEICNQQIDLPNWSKHAHACREREAQRMNNLAKSMSREPVTEKIPCDYCQQLCDAKQLHSHEKKCSRNPLNMKEAAKIPKPHQAQVVVLPVRENRNNAHPRPSNIRSPHGGAHYERIDVDRTHAANRPANSNAIVKQPVISHAKSDERISKKNGLSHADNVYENDRSRKSKSHDGSYENLSNQGKYGSPNSRGRPRRTSLENLRNRDPNEDPSRTLIYNRSPPNNHRIRGHTVRNRTGTLEVIDNDQNTPLIKKKKKRSKSGWFCCSGGGVYD